MKLCCTISARCGRIDSASDLKHMLYKHAHALCIPAGSSGCWSIKLNTLLCSVRYRTTHVPYAHTFAVMLSGNRTTSHQTASHWHSAVRGSFIHAQVYSQLKKKCYACVGFYHENRKG